MTTEQLLAQRPTRLAGQLLACAAGARTVLYLAPTIEHARVVTEALVGLAPPGDAIRLPAYDQWRHPDGGQVTLAPVSVWDRTAHPDVVVVDSVAIAEPVLDDLARLKRAGSRIVWGVS